MSLFCCPTCGALLKREPKVYRCLAGHCYDIAKEGYTYLLPPNQKHSSAPGDDKDMAAARRDFLSKGYYAPLLHALCTEICAVSGEGAAVFDAGCGEGYYTSGIFRALSDAGKRPRMAGVDISKPAVRIAAKREKDVEFAVASSYHLPLPDQSVDILLNCFSPLALEEFRRVLKPGGMFFYVVPAADHLWGLKEVLYDRPYRNVEKETPYEGFTYVKIVPVESVITLVGQADIRALFQMTPYYWKTPKSGSDRLYALERLDTQISFHIHIFQRNAGGPVP